MRAQRVTGIGQLALLGLAVLPIAPGALAQAVFGSIYGTVTDNTGAAVPKATVVVTDVAKGTSITVTSNDSGEFTAEHLIPDTYNVKIEQQGFKTFQQSEIRVFADQSIKVAAGLGVGSQDQTVNVNADQVPQLKTDRADVSTTFSSQDIGNLPIPDHNFANLQLLLPGAVQLGWAHSADENPQGSKQIQIDGQAFGGVNYTLDGTDNLDAILGIIVITRTTSRCLRPRSPHRTSTPSSARPWRRSRRCRQSRALTSFTERCLTIVRATPIWPAIRSQYRRRRATPVA